MAHWDHAEKLQLASQLNSSFMDSSSSQGIKCLFSSRQLTDPTMSLHWKHWLPNKQSRLHRLSRGRETLFQEATLLLGSLRGIFYFLVCREPDVSEDLTATTKNSFLKKQSGLFSARRPHRSVHLPWDRPG